MPERGDRPCILTDFAWLLRRAASTVSVGIRKAPSLDISYGVPPSGRGDRHAPDVLAEGRKAIDLDTGLLADIGVPFNRLDDEHAERRQTEAIPRVQERRARRVR